MKTPSFRPAACIVAGVIACTLIAGCAPKARKAEGHMDTPQTHYQQGMKYWDMGEYVRAEESFNLAHSLDRTYAPAVSGLALITAWKATQAATVDETRSLFREAIKLADRAQSLNNKIPEVFIAKALVLTMQHEGEPAREWLRSVEREYERAIKIDPNNAEAYYRRGFCYKKAFEFSKAAADFRKVLDIDQGFTTEANHQWELVQKIERAAPGTEVGKRIALVEEISRADIAALYISELGIDKLVTKRRPKSYDTGFEAPDDPRAMDVDRVESMKSVTDIDNHWARNFIIDIVDLNIRGLEPYPDRTFQPNELINRGEFAILVEEALIAILGDQDLATRHIGATQSRFPDVNPSHPAFNAACNAVDRGILSADMSGEFGMARPVSGPDALLAIRNLKNLNRIE